MKSRDFIQLLVLAAIWGTSFLFMRIAAPEFGPVTMAALRVGGATVVLLPLLAVREGLGELRREWRPLLIAALFNCALPFICFSYAALSITAGLSSILNATAPLFGALVAWLWLGQRLNATRVFGLLLGVAGVVYLAWGKASFKPGGSGLAILACLAASLCYGIGGNYVKRRIPTCSSLTVATASQLGAALMLGLPAALLWPEQMPSPKAWGSVIGLAVMCSALAYILYFNLIQRVGATNAIAVTFLTPVSAVAWAWLVLGEGVTSRMAVGCAVVLLGTSLAVGLLHGRIWQRGALTRR